MIEHGRRDGERVSGQENSVCTGLGKTRESRVLHDSGWGAMGGGYVAEPYHQGS